MQKLVEGHQFEVPQSLVEHQTSYRLESIVRDMIEQRRRSAKSGDVNWEGAREDLKAQAEADVRGSLLLERIAEEEKIDVSNEEDRSRDSSDREQLTTADRTSAQRLDKGRGRT